MATTKDRINISVSKRVRKIIGELAKRDQMPLASKAADLLEDALELEEDRVISEIANKRDVRGVRWVKDGGKLWK